MGLILLAAVGSIWLAAVAALLIFAIWWALRQGVSASRITLRTVIHPGLRRVIPHSTATRRAA